MSVVIQEFHTSPWVLPTEDIMGWLKWSEKEPVQEIIISSDPNIVFDELFNIVESISPTSREIKINVNKLEVQGFVGFTARYLTRPQTELDIEFTARLVDGSKKILANTKKATRIVRPIILVNATDSIIVKEGEKSRPQFRCQLINVSSAEALDVKPKFNVTSKPLRAIELVTENASSILESAPIRLLRLSKYISKINVRMPGTAKITLSFEYKDRLENTYETPVKELSIEIRANEIKEVPITNVLQGDAEPVEIPLATPIAW